MEEFKRISKIFSNLYNGSSWIEVTILGTLKSISSEKAFTKPVNGLNSIWEIVNHVVSWRETVLKRLKGEQKIFPDNNYFETVTDNSNQAWQQTLDRFEKSNLEWVGFFTEINDSTFAKQYDKVEYSFFELIMGILQHDTYHLGQIVLLKKIITLHAS
ncbi:MAG: DinB family protein [Ignavibacteriales bacterium]|nr:DinB family protein [Ignavibacteriales bacterium]